VATWLWHSTLISTHISQWRYLKAITSVKDKLSDEKHSRLQGIVDRVEQRLYSLNISKQNLVDILLHIIIHELISEHGSTEPSVPEPLNLEYHLEYSTPFPQTSAPSTAALPISFKEDRASCSTTSRLRGKPLTEVETPQTTPTTARTKVTQPDHEALSVRKRQTPKSEKSSSREQNQDTVG
jgi:hypothetical protein